MADNLNVYGIPYTGVQGIKVYDSSNTVQTFIKPAGTLSITENVTGIDVSAYATADVAVAGGGGGLPNTFQEVEYIECDGNQKFFVEFEPMVGDEAEGKAYVSYTKSEGIFATLFSAGADTKQWLAIFDHTSNSNNGTVYYRYFGSTVAQASSTGIPNVNGSWHLIRCGSNGYWIDNNLVLLTSTNTTGEIDSTEKRLMIFNRVGAQTEANGFKGRCGRLGFYRNLEPVALLVPCYRKADTVIGMYDIIGGVFYTNEGTGSFTKGSDV